MLGCSKHRGAVSPCSQLCQGGEEVVGASTLRAPPLCPARAPQHPPVPHVPGRLSGAGGAGGKVVAVSEDHRLCAPRAELVFPFPKEKMREGSSHVIAALTHLNPPTAPL